VDTLRRGEAPLDFLLGERSLCVNTTRRAATRA